MINRRVVVSLAVAFLLCVVQAQNVASGKVRNQDWDITTPAAAGLSSDSLGAMEKAVRAGDFKKIGSVLIARHGKLVYEAYFDGDASTPRDTRSATKTITNVLIGIAIGEKKLSGVDARIMSLLPERERK